MSYIKDFSSFISHLFGNGPLLFSLVRIEFVRAYLGSYLGLVWEFVQPISFMLVIWLVFEIGFRSMPIEGDTPFFLWLMAGMLPWFYFANALSSITMAVVNHRFLVKKVAFRVSILPLIPLGSTLIQHAVLIVFMMLVFMSYGYQPSIYWLQLPFYVLFISLFLLGLGWLTSSLRVFVKDVENVIAVVVQFGFWFTPIIWSISMVPPAYMTYIKLNPMYYIVQGYRDVFINHIWFWERPIMSLYFLGLTVFLLFFGALTFKRLRPHFGDVL